MQVRSADGTEIGYESYGSGPHLVFVHGGVSDREAWRAVADEMEGFTRHLMDRRGRGLSQFELSTYSFEREYEDIAAIVASLEGTVHVAGHSSGAICVLGAARICDIASLVLYEPPIPVLRPLPLDAIERMEQAVAEGRSSEAVRDGVREIAEVPVAVAEAMASDPKRRALIDTWARECRAINQLPGDASAYAEIGVPVLLLVGKKTSAYHRAGIDALAQALPRAEVAELQGQGHGALLAAPQVVASAITPFLARS